MSKCTGPQLFSSRREFLQRTALGIGAAALQSLLCPMSVSAVTPHFPARAKRVVYLFQSGGPSQLDLFDDKPILRQLHGQRMPESLTKGQRVAQLQGKELLVSGSPFSFSQVGQSGGSFSELLPHTAKISDTITRISTMQTDAINHDPAITLMQTGFQQPGRPCFGAWASYGLGSLNDNLPTFIVMVSGGEPGDQPVSSRVWSNGFLPSLHQGVRLRGGKEPVLYLHNPPGISRESREATLESLAALHQLDYEQNEDPEIQSKIAQYETAFRMQVSVPEVADLSDEPEHTYRLYGEDARIPGTYAANCLLARRLLERGVRFVQLYHRDWDHHEDIDRKIRARCKETDQASAALVLDLQQRGLLDDTLVIWGGEFGRTPMSQETGRDHHSKAFSVWLAGGGVQRGMTYGRTDDFGYNVLENPVHVHDLNATAMHCLGIDHKRLTFRYQARDQRLTDIAGSVVYGILA